MTTTSQVSSLTQADFYITLLKRSWWIIAVVTLVAINASLLFSYMQTPQYRATATFVVSPGITALDNNRDLLDSFFPLNETTLAITYSEVMQSGSVYHRAIELLSLDDTTASHYAAQAVVLPQSNVLELSVRGPNPIIAQSLTNAIGQVSIDAFARLYPVYTASFLDAAVLPMAPYSPTPTQDMAIAGFAGFVLGCVLAFFREQLIVMSRRS